MQFEKGPGLLRPFLLTAPSLDARHGVGADERVYFKGILKTQPQQATNFANGFERAPLSVSRVVVRVSDGGEPQTFEPVVDGARANGGKMLVGERSLLDMRSPSPALVGDVAHPFSLTPVEPAASVSSERDTSDRRPRAIEKLKKQCAQHAAAKPTLSPRVNIMSLMRNGWGRSRLAD